MGAFELDATPVTNGAFLAFVQDQPGWARGAPSGLLADSGYLAHWAGPMDLGDADPDAPVTWVSWHAARAYCQARGGDLPTTWQWEYAADATASAPTGARQDPDTLAAILAWYAEQGDAPPRPVGQGEPTVHGVHDLHGLVWEWTLDFDAQTVASDAREAGDEERLRFCGAGAISAADAQDYATFMRMATRDSLKAPYTTSSLGFRCAY